MLAAAGAAAGGGGAEGAAAAGDAAASAAARRASAGTRRVEGPRLSEISGLASSEGAAIPRVYGRARIGGQLIWATRFEEEIKVSVTRSKTGGKGSPKQKTVETTYSYYANLAIGLCEGPIAFVRRIWVDGRELDVATVAMRVHQGDEAQEPSRALEAAAEAREAPELAMKTAVLEARAEERAEAKQEAKEEVREEVRMEARAAAARVVFALRLQGSVASFDEQA